MTDQEKQDSITPQPDADKKETSKKEASELSEEELKKVSGGVSLGGHGKD